tara:strand:- start:1165 stop:1269 length:105 start_codon:yes stop_codon:yes gene_type:complete
MGVIIYHYRFISFAVFSQILEENKATSLPDDNSK